MPQKCEHMPLPPFLGAIQTPYPQFSHCTESYMSIGHHLGAFGGFSLFWKKSKNIAQGGALPKRDIVDPFTHASCATGPNMTKQFIFPTTWGNTKRVNVKELVRHEIQVVVCHLWPRRTVSICLNGFLIMCLVNVWTVSKLSLKLFWTLSMTLNGHCSGVLSMTWTTSS